MAEQFDLTAPMTGPSRTYYRIVSVTLGWENRTIAIELRGSDNQIITCGYTGTEAAALMTSLNTMNFSTVSLYKRLLQKLLKEQVMELLLRSFLHIISIRNVMKP